MPRVAVARVGVAERGSAAQLARADPRSTRSRSRRILLDVGVLVRDFALDPRQMALAFAAGLVTQWFWLRALGLEQKGVLSALITCFGLSLLLRADTLWVHPLAAVLAISSKFVLRVERQARLQPGESRRDRRALCCCPGTWVSPGQWGNDVALAGWFVALGALVTQRARRWDISWVFLAAWLGLVDRASRLRSVSRGRSSRTSSRTAACCCSRSS